MFIYSGLLNIVNPNQISTIIDDKNNFISIKYVPKKGKVVEFKDSFRIFPVSLEKLCSVFEVSGKLNKYNPLFNNINLFKDDNLFNLFKQYAQQDSVALYNALIKARSTYFESYRVDILKIYSTSTLSLKIFRTLFLKLDIPILVGKA